MSLGIGLRLSLDGLVGQVVPSSGPTEPGAMFEINFSISTGAAPRNFAMTSGEVTTGIIGAFWPANATVNLSMGVQSVGGVTPKTSALYFNPAPEFHTSSATYKWFLGDGTPYATFVDEVPLPFTKQIALGLLAAGQGLRLSVINNV